MRITVVPFAAEHLEPAAVLLAARHRADQCRVSGLPPSFGDPAVVTPTLETLLGNPTVEGFAALVDEHVVGYLIGERVLSPDTTLHALFFDPRAIVVPFLGYAAHGDAADAVYRALYAAAAAQWVQAGFFAHVVRTTMDPIGVEPWFSLGFGRRAMSGLRRLDPAPNVASPPALPAPFAARKAGPADVEVMHGLFVELVRFHAGSPVFFPAVPEAMAAGRDRLAAWLADPASGCWLAEVDGTAVGVVTVHPAEGFVDAGRCPAQCAYLFMGHTRAAARGQGLGTFLVEHGLAWAHREGYTTCVVDWFTANPLASQFWPRRGFVPFSGRLERRIDPRIAWAGESA